MESGDYQKAIDDYRIEYRKHPKDQSLVKGYVKSIEDIKEVADRAFNQARLPVGRKNLQHTRQALSVFQ